jgi:hypothetical protein
MSAVYLVWSEEHGAWWRPARCGYTTSLKRAGRYTREDAVEISDSANGGGTFCEVPVEVTADMALLCQLRSGGR